MIIKGTFKSPLLVLDWTSRKYFKPGVPWVAFIGLIFWAIIEAVIFMYTLSPTMIEVLSGITGYEPNPAVMAPILWILHLGYGWLAFGLVLKGVAIVTGAIPETTAIHALTIGAIGSMTMGVMSRAALGHTGRELTVTTAMATAYLLVSLAAIIRVSSAALPAGLHDEVALLSGAVWITAFLIFAATYWPILTRPRVSMAA